MADDRYISQVRLPDGSIYKIGGEPFTYNNTVAGDADDTQQPLAHRINSNTFVIYCVDDDYLGEHHLMTVGFERYNLVYYNGMDRHWGMAFYIGDSMKDSSPKKGTLMQQYCYDGYSAEFEQSHDNCLSLANLRPGTSGDCWLVKRIEKDPATMNPMVMWYLYDSRAVENIMYADSDAESIHVGHYKLEDAYVQDKGYRFRLNIDLSNHRFLRFTSAGYRGIRYIDNMPIHFEPGGDLNLIEIAYSDLLNERNKCQLIPGTWYRIVDYDTTARRFAVANHPFDIIVRADSKCELNENAYAIRNKKRDDEYFKDCSLGAWELKYCLDNDRTRFNWANPYGKGVIYWMKDEFGNEAPYDFKNILFTRQQSKKINGFAYGATDWEAADGKIIDISTLNRYIYENRALCMPNITYTTLPVYIQTDDESDKSYYFTFSYVEEPIPDVKEVKDYTLSGIASNNRIIPYMIKEVSGTATMSLPDNVCIAMQKGTKTPIFNDLTFSNCNGNTLILEGNTSLHKSEFNDCNFNIFSCIEGKNEVFDKLSNVKNTVMIGLGMNNIFDHINGVLLMPGCGGSNGVNDSKFSYIYSGASICGPVNFCDIQNLQSNSMIYDTNKCVTDNGRKIECLIYLHSQDTNQVNYPRTIHGNYFSSGLVIDFIDNSTNLPYEDWTMAYSDQGGVRYWKPS